MRMSLQKLLSALEKQRKSKAICYATTDRQGINPGQISTRVLDILVKVLEDIGVTKKITLVLHTRGGDPMAAMAIVNLLRSFSDELEVVVPARANSAGTLIALGADHIVLTKQAMLSPIDPSMNGPLNPTAHTQGGAQPIPVSVEELRAYVRFAKEIVGGEQSKNAKNDEILRLLAEKIHPLVLGRAYRSRAQIRALASKLITNHIKDEVAAQKTVDFLCEDSGSHDYPIFRREAQSELGLNIKKPTQQEYDLIRDIYHEISSILKLDQPYSYHAELQGKNEAPYDLRYVIVHSVGMRYALARRGTIKRVQSPPKQSPRTVEDFDEKTDFEGWIDENATQ